MLLTAEALRPPAGSLCHLGQDGLLTYAPEVTKLVIRLLAAAGADYRRAVCARMTAAAARPVSGVRRRRGVRQRRAAAGVVSSRGRLTARRRLRCRRFRWQRFGCRLPPRPRCER